MTVYEAIREMRRRSERREPFAFSYMSYSLTRRESHGEVEVAHAILYKNQRPAAPTTDSAASPSRMSSSYDDFMLTYLDCSTREVHHLWQPLLMTFDHQQLTSID